MAVAVVVVLAVRLVVALVVADEVLQREPVVGGDEVHRGPGLASRRLEDLARAGHHLRDPGELARLAAPECPDAVPVLVAPPGPADRKPAYLISAGADIPRLRDELDAAQGWVLHAGLQERRAVRKVVRI